MAVNLIRKHGLVPKSVYPESQSSSETRFMNVILKNILRTAACELRNVLSASSGAGGTISQADLAMARLHKEARLADVWKLLCIHLGTPPETFTWSWKDKSGVYNRWKDGAVGTPLDFYADFGSSVSTTSPSNTTCNVEEYVCLVHDPRNPFMQTYTVVRIYLCI
jgi:bleomycin hydrolase